MPEFLFRAALLGLVLLLAGALTMRWAREPATAYAGTIGAGIGVLILALHALGSLMG